MWPRCAGVLLHPTSLPGPHGIGDLGASAHRWIALLQSMGVGLWQVLPLGPTGYGDSPYQVFSAFAGNPLLLALDDAPARSDAIATPSATHVDFAQVIAHKRPLIARAAQRVLADPSHTTALAAFREQERAWLTDYALFMALKEAHEGAPWYAWPRELARRDPSALAHATRRLAGTIARLEAEQYLFAVQWQRVRDAARAAGVRLMGDVPIYVAHDSADVWTHPHLFQLHADGRLRVQAGVPPDYFSETGQLWGNPLYDWDAVRADGYAWWIARLRAAFTQFDIVRLDHFRGFEAYWEVAGDATTAVHGVWRPGPGAAFFDAVHEALGPVPIVAENLGVITPEVEALRAHVDYPGMCVLQFAFAPGDDATRPYHFPEHAVVYTGTHDNDTIMGWWTSAEASTQDTAAAIAERAFAARYLDAGDRPKHWAMMRAAFASPCHTAIVPWQDVLGLGSTARMNQPGRAEGNWSFRFAWADVPTDVPATLRTVLETYGRATRVARTQETAADSAIFYG